MKNNEKNEQVTEESYSLGELAGINKKIKSEDKRIQDLLAKEKINPSVRGEGNINDFLSKNIPGITVEKTSDENTLVDIHVNNPLKKIVVLLEEIKQQKAFSFTFRGSLGVMGVLLTLSIFGIFGGDKILCEKGLQTRIGTLKVLGITEETTDPTIPWTKAMIQKLFFITPTTLRQRVVLVNDRETPIHVLTLLTHRPELLNNLQVAITGNYNACSSTITLKNEQGIEPL